MINKVIKLKLQYFNMFIYKLHVKDPEVYVTCHDPKIYPHTKFGIPTSNYIQICSGLDLARTETRSQGHSDLEPVGNSPGPKMYLHTKYGTAAINNIGGLSVSAIFQDLTHEIKVTVPENSEPHSMTQTYIHKLNFGGNMSYSRRHALNTMFCLLSVSCLVGEMFLLTHDRYANSMLYK